MTEAMDPLNLDELLAEVQDDESFIRFLHGLAFDFHMDRTILEKNPEPYRWTAGPLGWQHGTIHDWLGAAGTPPDAPTAGNPWQRCAEILLMAKYCE